MIDKRWVVECDCCHRNGKIIPEREFFFITKFEESTKQYIIGWLKRTGWEVKSDNKLRDICPSCREREK